MNATVLRGAVVEASALVAPGSVVRENQVIPARTLAVGVPAKVKGEMSPEAQKHVATAASAYQRLMKPYQVLNNGEW